MENEIIGRAGTIDGERRKLRVPVVVRAVKSAYGRVCYLVAPVGGHGETWIDADRFREAPDGAKERRS